ncbi:MAG TPA: zinc-dependent alcohol dehydrogenase family protein [Verrucomicrobiota bacterium]|nr:zinc-dependent alcohol dehydrogenase family protein [Verrucomicrobiota bacterium]HRZ58529.1 zinc-dependent alcohol dehydrogenase family protein [Candidatus Paceibacterota bacterium]
MLAVIYEQFQGPLELRRVSDPTPPQDGVVVRVAANGICRSDWHGWQGHDADIRLPHVPGHELAGVIEAVGVGVRHWHPGDRVTVPFAVGCGVCPQCISGNPQVCDDYFQPGFTAWGSFAEFVALPHADHNLVLLPDDLGFVAAASLGCRFATSFRAVVQQGRVAPGEWVAVHGCGGIGLAAIMIACAMGAQVIAVDVRPEALACAQALGAVHTLKATRQGDVATAIHEFTGGGAHLSIDALGSRATSRNSILCLRKRGRHAQVGLMVAEDRDAPVPMASVIAKELEILGCHGMAAQAYPSLLTMIRAGKLDPQRLVGKTVTLAEAPAALIALGAFGGTGVTVIDRFDATSHAPAPLIPSLSPVRSGGEGGESD